MLSRRTLLLKPMQTAVSGYARLQKENGRAFVQLHAHGLPAGEVRLFASMTGQTARELGCTEVNANGEASFEMEAPADTKALLLLGRPPKPLLIGLCGEQDAGSLLEARNAALALCDRLAPQKNARLEPETCKPPILPKQPTPAAAKTKKTPSLPREIFLPAIDPSCYVKAADKAGEEPLLPPPKPSGPPADRLRPLIWPRGFAPLKPYFESGMPQRLLDRPGWRFVRAAHGLMIGMRAQDGRVQSIAYAYAEEPPQELRGKCRALRAVDGRIYHILEMKI